LQEREGLEAAAHKHAAEAEAELARREARWMERCKVHTLLASGHFKLP